LTGTRVSLLLVVLLALLASAASAKQHCAMSCKQETLACELTRCTGLDGSARRSCVETCKGIGGCAPLRTLAYVEWACDTRGGDV
jgi:hypothetical protein